MRCAVHPPVVQPWAAEHGESPTMVRLLLDVAPEIAHTGFDGDGDRWVVPGLGQLLGGQGNAADQAT